MSEEQLKETILHLRLELDHEREERNYFQLERDKINTFWEITKKVLLLLSLGLNRNYLRIAATGAGR